MIILLLLGIIIILYILISQTEDGKSFIINIILSIGIILLVIGVDGLTEKTTLRNFIYNKYEIKYKYSNIDSVYTTDTIILKDNKIIMEL